MTIHSRSALSTTIDMAHGHSHASGFARASGGGTPVGRAQAYYFLASHKVSSRRDTARTKALSAPSHSLPSDHGGSICAHGHLSARNGARQRLRRDGLCPGRRRGRHHRHHQPLFRLPRPIGRGEPHTNIRCVCVRVATCAAVVRLLFATATAAPPGPRALGTHDSPRPICRDSAGHIATAVPPQHSLGRVVPAGRRDLRAAGAAGTSAARSRK